MAISVPDTLTIDHSENYIVSIRLRSGGLSFSGYDPSVGGSFFHREVEFDRTVSFLSALKDCFFANDCLSWSFKRVYILSVNSEYTVVPDHFLSDRQPDSLLNFCLSVPVQRCMVNALCGSDRRLLYGMDEEVYEFCSRSFLHPTFLHYMSPLLEAWQQKSIASAARKMYVVAARRLDVVCYAQGELLFVNTFAVDQLEDLLYYILYVWKQVGLDAELDELHLHGEHLLLRQLLERLRCYIRHVAPLEMPSEVYLKGADVAKAPIDLISLLLCE